MKGLKGRGPASVRRPRFGPSKGHRKPGDRHREPLYRGGRVAWTDLGAQLDQSATRQAQHEKKEKKLKTARDWVKVTGTGKQRRKEYRCVDCDKWFPREEAKRPDDLSDITLDHVKAWAELKTELPTHTWLDDDGHEWTGYLQNDASAEYNDIDNLRPMCQSCNSVRGSDPKNKVYDSNFDPTHDPKTCPECTKDS